MHRRELMEGRVVDLLPESAESARPTFDDFIDHTGAKEARLAAFRACGRIRALRKERK
jgi:hypothetical protein